MRKFGPYFTKMALTYGFLVLVAVLFASIVLSVFSGIYLRTEIKESNTRLLKQVRIFFDYSVVRPVKGLIASRLLGGTEEAPPLVLETEGLPPDGYTLYQLSKSLKTFSTFNPLITTVFLYYPKADTVITSEHGAFVRVSKQGESLKKLTFYRLYERLRGETASSGWVTDLLLGYYQALPLFGVEDKTVFFGVILDVNKIRGEIERITDNPDIHVFVMNSGGIFLGTGTVFSKLPAQSKGSEGFAVLKESNRKFGVSWVRSSEEDWIYYLRIPFDILESRVTGFSKLTLILLAVVLMFCFTGVAYATNRLYKPLRSIVDTVTKQAGIGGKGGNELALIEQAFRDLHSRVSDKERVLEENRPLIIHKSIMDVLYGLVEDPSLIQERLQLAGLSGDAFRLAILVVNKETFNEFSAEMKEYTLYKISETIQSAVGDSCRVVRYAPWCLALIGPPGIELTPERLKLFTKVEVEGFALNANAVVVEEPLPIENLSSIFRELQIVELYGGIYGYGCAYTYREVRRNESSTKNLDPARLVYLKSLLFGGRSEEFLTVLRRDLEMFKQGGFTCAYIETYLGEVSSIIRTYLNRFESAQDISLLSPDTRAFSLYQFYLSSAEAVRALEACLESDVPLKDREFIARVCAYLEDFVDANTSLKGLADRFRLSQGHLSRLFKQVMGVSYQNYLIEVKLIKACKALRENREYTVEYIAKSLGYHNTSYFIKLFRQRFGITPMQYRFQSQH